MALELGNQFQSFGDSGLALKGHDDFCRILSCFTDCLRSCVNQTLRFSSSKLPSGMLQAIPISLGPN